MGERSHLSKSPALTGVPQHCSQLGAVFGDHSPALQRAACSAASAAKTLIVERTFWNPDPNDEHAPCVAVCDLIERLQSDPASDGFDTALYNRMGTTSRGITDGGDMGRNIAKRYRVTSERCAQWPRTAAIFAGLASQYGNQAGAVDREAEARRRRQPR